MMQKIIDFVKRHPAQLIIVALLLYIFYPKNSYGTYSNYSSRSYDMAAGSTVGLSAPKSLSVSNLLPQGSTGDYIEPRNESTNINPTDRKKIENFELSVAVNNVQQSISLIDNKVTTLGGFTVNSSFSKPGEAESGYITVRIPTNKKQEFKDFVAQNSVKIVSEYANGDDVTDQYKDVEERLSILQSNKARFEEIMRKAEKIEDILQVQQEIFSLQNQIDSLVGQKKYIEQTSSTTRYSINLSTDEYAFSYLPKDGWEPKAVFKEAVRSLVLTVRGLANKLIWVLVYSIIWLPLLIAATFLYFRFWRKK